jgi:hypothetical protein
MEHGGANSILPAVNGIPAKSYPGFPMGNRVVGQKGIHQGYPKAKGDRPNTVYPHEIMVGAR